MRVWVRARGTIANRGQGSNGVDVRGDANRSPLHPFVEGGAEVQPHVEAAQGRTFETGTWIGWVLVVASRRRAAPWTDCTKRSHISHSGKMWCTALNSMNRANPSFSHRCVHHSIVTKLPNHMCASSWQTVRVHAILDASGVSFSSMSSRDSRSTVQAHGAAWCMSAWAGRGGAGGIAVKGKGGGGGGGGNGVTH